MRPLLVICALVLLLAGLFFYLACPRRVSIQVYQGKTIQEWFEKVPITAIPPQGIQFQGTASINAYGQQYGSADEAKAALDAMDFFGTNAMPFLLAKLEGTDSGGEIAVTKAAAKTGVSHLPFRHAHFERLQAVTSLIHAKALSSGALQKLTVLSTNSNTNIAMAAAYILKRRQR